MKYYDVKKDGNYYKVLGLINGDGWIGKYSIGFCSKDKELVDFVDNVLPGKHTRYERKYTQYKIKNKEVNKNGITYYVIIHSKQICKMMKEDLIKPAGLEYVDGLLCAEGCVHQATISFSQKEPAFSKEILVIEDILGPINFITANQNECKQAHWSIYDLRKKHISLFSVCERKRKKYDSYRGSFSRNSKKIEILNLFDDKSLLSCKEAAGILNTKEPNMFLRLERLTNEGLLKKAMLETKHFGRCDVVYSLKSFKRGGVFCKVCGSSVAQWTDKDKIITGVCYCGKCKKDQPYGKIERIF